MSSTTDNETIVNNCSGDAGTGQDLFNYWNTHDCPLAYQRKLNTGTDGKLEYNSQQQTNLQAKITQLFQTYQKTNTITNNVTDPRYNVFQETLLELCLNQALPGICQTYLTNNLCAIPRSDAIGNETLTNFCGCFVPADPNYSSFIYVTPPCLVGGTGCTGCAGNTGGCVKMNECDPLCHRATSVKKAILNTGAQITCPQNVCVISDVVISAQNSKINGAVNFNTVCGGCNTNVDGCFCVLSGINISETAASVGLSTNFNQYCSTDSVCLVPAGNGTTTPVPCKDISAANIGVSASQPPNIAMVIVVLVILVIVILILMVLLL